MGAATCGGRGFKGRAVSGDRPTGATRCRPKHTMASCQHPPPPPLAQPRAQGCNRRDGPQRRPQKRLDRRLEEVAKAVGGGYCRLQMPLSLAFGVTETAAGHRLGALEGGGGTCPPPSNTPLPVPTHRRRIWLSAARSSSSTARNAPASRSSCGSACRCW